MYSYEDRIRAVDLYIKQGKRVGPTIRQCGSSCWPATWTRSILPLRPSYWVRAKLCLWRRPPRLGLSHRGMRTH